MSLKFNNLMISSENPKALVEFYSKVFGKPQYEMGDFTGWMIGSAGIMIAPHSEVKGKNAMPGRMIFFLETTDVKGEFDRIKEAGGEVVSEPNRPEGAPEDGMLACLADPDGNYLQLVTPIPEM